MKFYDLTRRSLWQICVVGLLSTLAACGDSSKVAPGPGTLPYLIGVVSHAGTGAKIQGAQVTAAGKSSLTGPTGYYNLEKVPQGALTIKVTHPDYVDAVRDVVIPVSFEFTADFQLQPK